MLHAPWRSIWARWRTPRLTDPRARPPSRAFGLARPIAELAPRDFLLRARRQAGPTAGWRVARRWRRSSLLGRPGSRAGRAELQRFGVVGLQYSVPGLGRRSGGV